MRIHRAVHRLKLGHQLGINGQTPRRVQNKRVIAFKLCGFASALGDFERRLARNNRQRRYLELVGTYG